MQHARFLCVYVNFFRSFSCPGMLIRWSDRTGRIPQSRNLPGCSSEAGRAAYLPSHLSFLHIPAVIVLFCFRSAVHKNIPLQRTSSHAKPYTPLAQIYFV